MCCIQEVEGTVKILLGRNLRDIEKSYPMDAKEGRQKSLKDGQILAQAAAPPLGPSLPPSWPHFVLAGQCCRCGCLSPSCSSVFEASTCQISWGPSSAFPQEKGSSSPGLDCAQLPQALCPLAPVRPPSCWALLLLFTMEGHQAGSEHENCV